MPRSVCRSVSTRRSPDSPSRSTHRCICKSAMPFGAGDIHAGIDICCREVLDSAQVRCACLTQCATSASTTVSLCCGAMAGPMRAAGQESQCCCASSSRSRRLARCLLISSVAPQQFRAFQQHTCTRPVAAGPVDLADWLPVSTVPLHVELLRRGHLMRLQAVADLGRLMSLKRQVSFFFFDPPRSAPFNGELLAWPPSPQCWARTQPADRGTVRSCRQ